MTESSLCASTTLDTKVRANKLERKLHLASLKYKRVDI